jgi:aspartate-semialdehyde dehydrogenase
VSRFPVAVLGATGVAGRQALRVLANHPWFEVAAVAASAGSAGRRLGDVLDERRATTVDVAGLLGAPSSGHGGAGAAAAAAADSLGTPTLPAALADLRLQDVERLDPRAFGAIFSMLPSAPARAIEARCAQHVPVFSTASAWRMDEHTPLLLAGVNAEQIARLAEQQRAHGWRGFVAPGPNCTVVGLAVSLAPLLRSHGVRSVTLTSMQAVSGAGGKAPAVAAAVVANVLPWIDQEEEKVEREAHKILGASFPISATCTRVPVEDGHTLSVSVALEQPATPEEAAVLLRAEDPWRGRKLPSAPAQWIDVSDRPDRPQPRLDCAAGGGLTTTVGRLRRDAVHGGIKYVVLSHNAVLGAAGGAVLLAEDLADRGMLPER